MKRVKGTKSGRALLHELPKGFALGFPQPGEGRDDMQKTLTGGSGGHPYVMRPDGLPLRDPRGMPMKISSSPGSRAWKNDLARVRRALRHYVA